MYTNQDLKNLLKKCNKLHSSLLRTRNACNSAVYNEQNTEEINDVKAYIEYKIDLLNDISNLITNFLKGNLNSSADEMAEELNNYRAQFNALTKDSYLSRLQQIYSRQFNAEIKVL